MLTATEPALLLEAWRDGYISRFVHTAPLRDMTARKLLVETAPLCFVLTGSGVHLTWQIILLFQSSRALRRRFPELVEKFTILQAVPDIRKENMGA